MLHKKDFRYNFIALKCLFWLPWFPFKFEEEGQNGSGGRLLIYPENHRRRKLWNGCKILALIHCFFISGRILEALLVSKGHENVDLDLFPFLLVGCISFAIINYVSLVLFGREMELNVKIFNELVVTQSLNPNPSQRETKNETGAVNPGAGAGNGNGKNNYLYLIIRYFPFTSYGLLCIYPILYVVQPDLCALLISLVDHSQRSFFITGICLGLDMLAHLVFLFVCHFVVLSTLTLIVRFVEITQQQQIQIQKFHQLKGVEARLCSPFSMYKSLGELKLLLSLFNLVFGDSLFLCKMFCLVGSIGNGFSTIRVIQRKRILGLMYLLAELDCILGAMGMFDSAYQITSRTEQLKRECRLVSQNLAFQIKRSENRMRLRSIPRMGLQMGEFYLVEREATPIFMNYVFNQISSLLITFP